MSCAAALANIAVIERDGILEHVRDISFYFAEHLHSLADLPLVANVRASGLVGCVECLVDTSSPDVTDFDKRIGARIDAHCAELGLIVRPLGNMCVMSPALIIARDQIDAMIGILREGIERAAAEIERGELV